MNEINLRRKDSGCPDPKLLRTIFNICELSGFKIEGCEERYLKRNASWCLDPTAYQAIKNIERDDENFHKLLHTIFNICELSGFRIEGRIVLVDEVTGKIWR